MSRYRWFCMAIVALAPFSGVRASSSLSVDVEAAIARADRAVQRNLVRDGSTGATSRAESAHHAESLRAMRIDDARLSAKRDAVLPFLEKDGEQLRSLSRFALPASGSRLQVNASAPGGSCLSALSLVRGSRVDLLLPRGGEAWFVLPGANHGRAITTRGSSTDASLAAWSDCREQAGAAMVSADDGIGLQGDLALVPGATERRVRVRNEGAEGEIVVSVVDAITVSGRIVREGTNEPLSGIAITGLFGTSPGLAYPVGSSSSDGSGQYAMAVFSAAQPDENLYVRTGSAGAGTDALLHEAWPNVACRDASAFSGLWSCTIGTPTALATTEGSVHDNVDFALGSGATLRGRVIDEHTGAGIANASVNVLDVTNGGSARSAQTDAAGRYRIDGYTDVTVKIEATSPMYLGEVHDNRPCAPLGCQISSGDAVQLSATNATTVDFSLTPHAYIEVDLTMGGESGSVESGAVELLNANGAVIAYGHQIDGDSFRIGPVATGSYRVRARDAGRSFSSLYGDVVCATDCLAELGEGDTVVVAAAGDRPRLTIDLRVLPSATGVVRDASGRPLAGVVVRMFPVSQTFFGWLQSEPSDSAGRYRVDYLRLDTYIAVATSNVHVDEVWPDLPCESSAPVQECLGGQPFTISIDDDERAFDFSLMPSARFKGRIQNASNFYADVMLLGANNALPGPQIQLSLQSDGSYVADDVVPGTWRIAARNGQSFAQVWPGATCTNTGVSSCPVNAGTPVVITSDVVRTGIDFQLWDPGSLRGRIVDETNGMPLAGVMVDAWNVDDLRVASTATDATGYFAFSPSALGSPTAPMRFSTDNYLGYVDEVLTDVQCAVGSVYLGTCSLDGATTFAIPVAEPSSMISVRLDVSRVFANGFE